MTKTIIKDISYLVTADADHRVYRDYDLLIEGGNIVRIARGIEDEGAKIISGKNRIVYPGLVNTHHHFYQVLTRNIPEIQHLELFDWLIWLYERWRHLTPDMVYDSSLLAMGELVQFGCTTMVDHHYVFPKNQGDLISTQFEAAKKLGVRLHATRGSMSKGKSDGGLPPDDLVQTTDEILEDSIALIDAHHDTSHGSFSQVILAPCSPFSVSADLLRQTALLAREKGVLLHTHLAETEDEVRFCLDAFCHRPLAYMESLGWTGPDVFFAHGIHFNDAELDLLARTQTGVAHCPVSNMKLSSGVARVSEMLAMGIPLGLAVDGSASNDSSNLLNELRVAYLLQRLTFKDKTPAARAFLDLATGGGAKLLHRPDLGSLEVGKCADLFMVRADSLSTAGCLDDVAGLPATVGIQEPVSLTMVGGQVVYADGNFTHMDADKLQARVNAHSQVMR